ncbi:hypothetical protein GIB67_028153 [Kingdonia uniflora]|uniref:Uncharacterized protein n=1 Tax=Kingdonia uniflora TaxID=39325 RepID=A0A7J7KZX9_9MAGN|nr:hypothetical protein GIB67_028153 [Kingdonia uniflora]
MTSLCVFGLTSKIEEICDVVSVMEIKPEERKLGNSIGSGLKVRMGSINGEDNGSIIEETESVAMGFEELVVGCWLWCGCVAGELSEGCRSGGVSEDR